MAICKNSVLQFLQSGEPEKGMTTLDVIEMTFPGSSSLPIGIDDSGSEYNFILGSDPTLWRTGARGFFEILYPGIWDGIDLSFIATERGPKYEFRVGPGADPSLISMFVQGGDLIGSGSHVIVKTANSQLIDRDLIVYERSSGRVVDCEFEVDDNKISFSLGPYDRSDTLIIDPLLSSTYFGGTSSDRGTGTCYDEDGNILITGFTLSSDLPVTPGSYDTIFNDEDAYISKFNYDCSKLLFCTYIGGSEGERGMAIGTDDYGNIYVGGYSHSLNFPTTSDAYSSSYAGGSKYDNVVFMLDSSGKNLVYSTYIGGKGIDNCQDIKMDPWGRFVITGYTSSTDYPVTSESESYHGGEYDFFLTCLDHNSSSLAYSILLGGSGKDVPLRIALDDKGNVFIAGYTTSSDIVTTSNAMDSTYNGLLDGLVIGIGGNGSNILYSSYIGGSNDDYIRGIAISDDGDLMITGMTLSSNLPYFGPQHRTITSDGKDAFVMRVDLDGSGDGFISGIGGNGEDRGGNMIIDGSGNIWISGITYSTDFPTMEPNEGSMLNGDVFILCLNEDASKMLYSMVFGGNGYDSANDMDMSYGSFAIFGLTNSNDLPMMGDPYSTTYLGNDDCFVALLSFWDMPGIPGDLEARSGDGWVYIEWSEPSRFNESGSLGYVLRKGLSPDHQNISLILNDTKYLDLDVTNGIRYYYKVCAYNDHGDGRYTNVIDSRPAAPPGIPVSANITDGDRWVNISWESPLKDGGDPVIGYRIYRTSNDSQPHSLFKTVYEKRINDTDVVNGVAYRYKISAFNINGEGNMTDELIGMPSTIPDEPLEIYAQPGDGWVNVSWSITPSDGGSPILHYEVMRGLKADSLVHLDHTEHALHLLDTEVENGMEYHYAVRACNIRGPSPLSDIIRARPARQPDPPFDLTAESGDRKVILKWSSPEWDGGQPLNSFTIYRRSDENWTYLEKAEPHDSEFTDSEVINGIEYHYMITAWNIMGESLSSNIAYALPMTYPGKPLSLVASGGDRNVSLTWLPPISNGGSPLIEYMLHRGETSSSMELITELPPDKMEYTDLGLENGVTYYYQIWCRNSVGASIGSDLAFAIPATIPQPPSSISAIAGNSFVEITWGPTDDAGGSTVKKTILYRGLNESDVKKIADLDMTSGTYNDRSVENGVEYHYRLSCVNSLGEGPLSIPVVARPSTTPEMVLNLTCIIKDGGIHLTWNPPLNDGGSTIHGYNIYRSSGSGQRIKLAIINDTYYSDGSVYKEILYVYSVREFNDNGEGEGSNEIEIMMEKESSIMTLVIGAVIAIMLLMFLLVGAALYLQKRMKRKKFVAGPPITAFPATEAIEGQKQEILHGTIDGEGIPSEAEVTESTKIISEPMVDEIASDMPSADPTLIQSDTELKNAEDEVLGGEVSNS
ncbi:MAG: SBBP repeat-containing protein [Candidatus Thermoplasmatota archaeon]|nr:SBBP repeat-containing protein [Candidatus Thermoplasmatota archaeon]